MSAPPRQRLLFVVNHAAFFVSHRLVIARAAMAAGFDVHVASAPGAGVSAIEAPGIIHHPLPLSRNAIGPLRELRTMFSIYSLMRRLRPDVVHLITSKPVIYGGVAARMAAVRHVIAAIAGLGHVFVGRSFVKRCAQAFIALAYRFALSGSGTVVIVQNPADAARLVQIRATRAEKLVLIRGSGVDLAEYPYTPEPEGVPVVIFAARLLRTKGVDEFLEAARRLRAAGVAARFAIAGEPDPGNSASVTEADLASWRASGSVEVLGFRTDVARLFADANLVVLPSYYGEGLPKVLIEAAACGRAVVTTDMPGCRDAIEPGITGLTVPPRDVAALVAAIGDLLRDSPRRAAMGAAGRALAEREYSVEHVVARHLELYRARDAFQ